MEKLQKRLGEIEAQLGDPVLYDEKNKNTLQPLLQEQAKLQTQLQETEESWLMVSEELEAASQ
jgi:ATP-binding cassette subfamily F protein 3